MKYDKNNMIKLLQEGDSSVLENTDMNYAINSLMNIQDSLNGLSVPIVYTAEMVPVVFQEQTLTDEDGNDYETGVYVVEHENLVKLVDSQNISISEAIDQIIEVTNDAVEDGTVDKSNFAIVIKEEDVESIEDECKSDPVNMAERCSQVIEYITYLRGLLSEGYIILLS